MKKINFANWVFAISFLSFFASCSKNAETVQTASNQQKSTTDAIVSENGTNPDEVATTSISSSPNDLASANTETTDSKHHFVYTESNGADGNQILMYSINHNGSLTLLGTTVSGGMGTGKGLGSQGALALSNDKEWLFAVNAGSNSVSSFKIHEDGSLTLSHTENTDGTTPTSITVHNDLLYVLNTGSDNIHGFRIGENGELENIKGSTQSLSGTGVGGAEVSFSPSGDFLVVTEKATNKISSFKLKYDGSIGEDVTTPATGVTPYGFSFSRNSYLLVSNAVGGAAGASTTTSYSIKWDGTVTSINGAVADNQSAACWLAVTKYGRYAFVTNTESNSISSYYVSESGHLTLVNAVAASTDKGPLDIIVAENNHYVYEINSGGLTIGAYYRTPLGGLQSIGSASGLPSGAAGIVEL